MREDAWYEWQRRRAGCVELPEGPIQRVVVICHGNICRSPFAAELLVRRVPGLEVRSAGLEATEGKPAEPGARRTARGRGIDLEAHKAHRLGDPDVEWAELILGMQGRHRATVARRWPCAAARTRLLGDFLPAGPYAIEDPWGESDAVFEATFDQIEHAVDALRTRLAARASIR